VGEGRDPISSHLPQVLSAAGDQTALEGLGLMRLRHFTRVEALQWVDYAEAAIKGLHGSPRSDRRALAKQVFLKKRP